MDTLLDVQCAVRDALCAAQPAVLALIAGPDAAERLDIYRSTIRGTLVKALRLTYPAVQRLVGEDFFDWAAALYIEAHPATDADLNRYGRGLPDFLAELPACAHLAYLPDVARLDAAIARALHAEDAQALCAEGLGELIAKAYSISFVAHPATTVLASRFPVHAIWEAALARDDAALNAIDLGAGPDHLLVHRVDERVHVLALQAAHWQFTAALFSGRPFGEVMAAYEHREHEQHQQAGAWLAGHLAAGRIVSFTVHRIEDNT